MTRKTKIGLVIAAMLLLVGGASTGAVIAASGITVTINGVDVTGLQNQKFEGCTVEFDDQGNIVITAPGYEIKKVSPGPEESKPQPDAVPPTAKYYIYTEFENGEQVGDEYSIIVNGDVVQKFESKDGAIVEDITKHLSQGTNQITITAVKTEGYSKGSSKSYFRIVIGEGYEKDNKAVIEKTLHKFTRTASDDEPGQTAYKLEAE